MDGRCPCCRGAIYLKESAFFSNGELMADLQATFATDQEWSHGPAAPAQAEQ